MASCFSPAQTTSRHEQNPSTSTTSSTSEKLGSFLVVLLASLSHLAAKLKPQHGGSPRKFVSNVSNKAVKLVHRRNNKNDQADQVGQIDQDEALWQRAILMGDKCQPLEFSGVIHYDQSGNLRSEPLPRSPRSPLPGYLQAL